MKLIVGLGNPGLAYSGTRHNVGFAVIKALSREFKIPLKKEKGILASSGKGIVGGETVVLAMPLTYMNLSGQAVGALLKKYRLTPQDLLVVCDDLDLEFGRIKIRPSGSGGGNRGLGSIIDTVSSSGFARLRVGIGRPSRHLQASEYVLLPFTRQEKQELAGVIKEAVACCDMWAAVGIERAMNLFNKKTQTSEE